MFLSALKEHLDCMAGLEKTAGTIEAAADLLASTLQQQHKILICGNGGSAADAQHFAAELIGRFEREREAWPAVALTTDTSILSAIGNDYGFDNVFARQVEGLGCQGDTLIAISTSGNSKNVLRAVASAKIKGMPTIGLLGRDGGALAAAVDQAVVVQNSRTARIQEGHLLILHYWASYIERVAGGTA
jgi:D-sedoheptulose 7-phosphate isomerase